MSSPFANNADVGILAQNQPDSDDASSVSEEPEFNSRLDVYEAIQYGTDYCGNCCYVDIADGSTTSPALPSAVGLRISGVGDVPLPICDEQTEKIKARAEIGENGTCEINADKIKLQHPQWERSFKKLVETVAYKLGVNPSYLTAELDGLVYMEKGGFVERKNSSVEGAMGTLIIQLLSKFTGGALTIYYSIEDDEEYEESFECKLGAGKEAAYSCHFACFFSDSEYEIAKLRSGSRVFLSYSLHFKNDGRNEIPSASMVSSRSSEFVESLAGLPPVDRMVVIPLEKQYHGIELVNSGINALSRAHRQKAEALKAAGDDWELLIVDAKLVHHCGFDHSDKISIVDAFDEKGKRVTSEMSWLTKTIDFSSIQYDNGMLLACDNDEECVSNWGTCKSTKAIDDGTEGTYLATFLVLYDPSFEMELKCLGSKEVAEACEKIVETRDYALLDRLLSVVESKEKCKFDVKSCQMLIQMLLKSRKASNSLVALVNNIIAGFSSYGEPNELLYDTIIDAIEKFGHDELSESIGALLKDAKRKTHQSLNFFLRRMEFALKLNKRIGGKVGLNYLELATNDVSRIGNTGVSWSTSAATTKLITDMISTYDDTDLSSVVQVCLNFFHRGTNGQGLHTMLDRADLLKMLLDTNKFGSLESSLVEFAADFAQKAASFSTKTSRAKLRERKDLFVQAVAFLIEFGTRTDCDTFGKYVIRSSKLFSEFIDAIVSVNGPELLLGILNKCLLQYSIRDKTFLSQWIIKKNILSTPSLHVKKVLELCPSIAQMMDKDKRLPLHHAVASATASFEVIMEVFEAYKHAASVRDPVTGLYPFQLAASNGNEKASFSLLLAYPNLVSSGIKVSDRKRKRSS